MRTVLLFSIALIVLSASPRAQNRPVVPAPDAVFGFAPGADYKLATYDQSIDYFKKLAAASQDMKLVEAGKTTQGRPMYFALVSSPENLAQDRSVSRDRAAAGASAGPDRRGRAAARARRQGVRAHRRRPAFDRGRRRRSTRRSCSTTSSAAPPSPTIKAMLDNVVADAVADHQSRRPADGGRVVHAERRHAVRAVGTAAALSGVRRPRQQPRRLHAEHGRVARASSTRGGSGSRRSSTCTISRGPFPTRIWLPPFSEPVGIDAPFVMSREVNMIGMAIAKGLEERGQVGATHMGTAFDAWYPGYIDYAPNFKNIAAFWTETALYQYADAARVHDQRFPAEHARPAAAEPVLEPVAAGLVAAARRGRLHGDGVVSVLEYAAKYKESLLLDRYQAGRDQIALGQNEGAVRVLHPAGAARSGRRGRAAAAPRVRRRARVAADRRRRPSTATRFRPAPGWFRPTRNSRRWRARCSTSRRIPTCGSIPGGPPERPYDAAGWSLPLQMGVRVVAGGTRRWPTRCARSMKRLAGARPERDQADAVRSGAEDRRRAVRQRARASASTPIPRRRRSCRRRADRPAAGSSACRSIRRRTTRSARSTARGSRARPCRRAPVRGAPIRYVISGLSGAQPRTSS